MSEAVWILVGGVLGAAATAFGMLATVRRVVRRQVRAERRARDAARLAEIGSMTKGLAHEIKNPLSTIGLNAQLLGEALEELEIDAGERDRLVRRAGALTREVERLREILEDFLRYAGEFRLAPGVIDLGAAAREFGDFFEPQAAREGVRLEVRVEGEVRAWADTDAVKQALLNLALNATQAMGSTNGEGGGAVVIGASLGEDEEVGACALLWVSDEGPGVPEEKREEIFRPYFTSRRSGAGLGLAITRRIAEELGGRVWVEGNEPRGARFVVALPRDKPGEGE